jgi:hypothetical protein
MKLTTEHRRQKPDSVNDIAITTYQPDDELRDVVHCLVRCLQSFTLTAERFVKVIERATKGD